MKYLFLIISMLPFLAFGQDTTTVKDGSRFNILIDGNVTIEQIRDSVVTDTAYVNLPPHDNSFLHSVDWTHKVDREAGEERINFVIKTENVDSLITEVRCGNEWVKERVFPDSDDEIGTPSNTMNYGVIWDCDSDLIYQFRAHKGVWEQAIKERFPSFVFELTESEQAWVDSVKKKSDIEMGIYWTDFSEYQTGFQPDDWTKRHNTQLEWIIEEDSSFTGGKYLHLEENMDVGTATRSLSWDIIDSDLNRADAEILYLFSSFRPSDNHTMVRAGGAVGSETMLRTGVSYRSSNDFIQLLLWDEGSNRGIVSDNIGAQIESEVRYWHRVRVNGSIVQSRIWEEGQPEPSAWQMDRTQTEINGVGWVGLQRFNRDAIVKIDVFSVATGGQTAPMEDPNVGGDTIEGGSNASIQINSTGSGEKAALSGADSSVLIDTTQSGQKATASGSISEVEIATTQAGQKEASGGAATEIIINTSQAGQKSVSGGSSTAISITAVGVGTALEVASGGSDASISISAAGDGFKRALDGANATVTIVGEGAGEKSISSGSDAMVLIATNGEGQKHIFSGAQAQILIQAFGAGFVESEFEIADINVVLKQAGMEGIFKTGGITGVFNDRN